MKKKKVSIIDYGLGNLFSVQNAFQFCGAETNFVTTADEVRNAELLVIPGVGAFEDGMNGLKKLGLIEAISEFAAAGGNILGICLGMQLLLEESEEFGNHKGLGLIPGRVKAIPLAEENGKALRLPHMGWNDLQKSGSSLPWKDTVLENNKTGENVYFAHSFMARPADAMHILSVVNYGGYEIPAVIQKGNIAGCQFHPEKSAKTGLTLLKTFLSLNSYEK